MPDRETSPEYEQRPYSEQIFGWDSYVRTMNKIVESEEPPSQEVSSAFDEAKIATTRENYVDALERIFEGLKTYDRLNEIDGRDAYNATRQFLETLKEQYEE